MDNNTGDGGAPLPPGGPDAGAPAPRPKGRPGRKPKGTVPAVVNQEDFERVQVKLALNKKQATRNNKRHSYLLRRWSVVERVNPPALPELPTEDSGITSVAVKPSRSTRSMISDVVRDAFPLSSWMFWCGRTCASSSPDQSTSLTLYSEPAADSGYRNTCNPANRL